jgi:DNA polymerase III epsilon subunit family exonuclease
MNWKDQRVVAFDTETTGLDPFGGDRVIEIALVVMRVGADGRPVELQHHAHFVNPGMPIPRKVTEITGIRDADVADAPPFGVLAADLAEIFDGAIAVAHNYPFDLAFLTEEFAKAGVMWREPLAAIDTVDVSMKHAREAKSHKLGDVAKRLAIPLDEAHRAAHDAEACGRVFLEMARLAGVSEDLDAMLDWADAIGRPPEGGPLRVDAYGTPTFAEGPHAGEAIFEHPLHLAWIEKAKVRRADGWHFRFPESTRQWVRRWLKVRASGRARQNVKSFRADDWTLDSCIASSRAEGTATFGRPSAVQGC